MREPPVATDKVAVPSKQRRGRDEERSPALTRKQPRERRKERTVGGGEARSCHLTADHGELITKDGDFNILLVRRWTDTEEQEQLADQ